MSSNTYNFAKTELDILVKSAEPENRPIIEEFIPEILALCDKFGNSGQSGGSAAYTAESLSKAIKSLCLQKSICPITGIDEEWVDVSSYGDSDSDIVYQNKRCSALFKNKDGRCWYLDAIIWKTQHDQTWGGNAILPNESKWTNSDGKPMVQFPCPGTKITGHQYVKVFPFEPKTFYVDVFQVFDRKNGFDLYVIDKKQLEEVVEYYQTDFIL